MKTLEQLIAQTVRLEDVVKRYAELFRGSKSGKTLRCNCLFHRDNGKSFHIKVTDQIYECCVCKETGNVIDLVQALVGCKEMEALYVLADWFSIPIKEPEGHSIQKSLQQVKWLEDVGPLYSAHENRELMMIFDSLDFCKCNDPAFATTYRRMEIGVSPNVLPDKYETLAGVIIFPVRNEEGRLQGFLKYMVEAKEQRLNCYPANLVDVSLLGLYQAIEAIRAIGFVYLVWNCKDLLTMHAAGFTNTVACYGSNLTYRQIDLLLKYTDQIVIIYTSKVIEQVKMTKAAARLSFASAVPYLFPLSKKDLSALYRRMGTAKFEYFVRQSTRLSFLNVVKEHLLEELQVVTEQLHEVQSKDEKVELRLSQIAIRNKLDKLMNILEANEGYLYRYFK